MQNRYALFKRRRVFYCEDSDTAKQESLQTRDRVEAQKLIAAKNDAANPSYLNRALGRTYLSGQDPKLVTRKWSEVMEKMIGNANRDSTRLRNTVAFASSEFDLVRDKALYETSANDFLAVLQSGKPRGQSHPETIAQSCDQIRLDRVACSSSHRLAQGQTQIQTRNDSRRA